MNIQNQKLNIKESLKDYYYVVPDYQREYVWTEENVTQLLEDICDEYHHDPRSEYFIGSIVVNKREDNTYEVIDGQQRLTTLYLVLCAFRRHFKERQLSQHLEIVESLLRARDTNNKGEVITNPRLELQYADTSNLLMQIMDDENLPENSRGTSARIVEGYPGLFTPDPIRSMLKERFR